MEARCELGSCDRTGRPQRVLHYRARRGRPGKNGGGRLNERRRAVRSSAGLNVPKHV